jgi:hypothetical protein
VLQKSSCQELRQKTSLSFYVRMLSRANKLPPQLRQNLSTP